MPREAEGEQSASLWPALVELGHHLNGQRGSLASLPLALGLDHHRSAGDEQSQAAQSAKGSAVPEQFQSGHSRAARTMMSLCGGSEKEEFKDALI